MDGSCCTPSSGRVVETRPPAAARPSGSVEGMVLVPGGSFLMGSEAPGSYPADGEAPVRRVEVDPFRIDACAVSNADFARFVAEAGHVSEAEHFGWSFVFGGLLPDDFPPTQGVAQAPWWRKVDDADWRHPEGPHSGIDDRLDHPAVHISWNDAQAYAAWAGKRLPTEAEWEYAARGGLEQADFPWGDELEPGGEHRMNVWQGEFPRTNTQADGFLGTAPVRSFPPNGHGLYNATGNTWEWVADWFAARRGRLPLAEGTNKVQKGGSYLCHASYCRRYRVAARQGSTPDSSTGNVGFRCAGDA